MATIETVKAKLQGLIDRSNGVTGENNGNLSDAMDALVAGYGQGGGTLAIKSGTVTLSVSYSMPKIQHGCGKLPYAVFMISENKEIYDVNRITGALWHRNSICTLFSGNGVKRLWGFSQQYDVENEAPTPNGLVVTESTFYCSPPAHFNGGTYHWIAIYEV